MSSGVPDFIKVTEHQEDYSTAVVETHEGEWTAQISRQEGDMERVSALIDVGSISHLINAYKDVGK